MVIPLSLLSPLILLAAACLAASRPGARPGPIPKLAEGAALLSLACAAAGAFQLVMAGPVSVSGLQQDALSATMALLVAFIGWVVVRYARSYLDGEAREGAFHAATLATTAAVLVLVQAGDLLLLVAASLAVGAGLRWLLLFYRERPAARRAAAKFTLVWAIGDVALILAALLLWVDHGTTSLAAIRDVSPLAMTPTLHFAVAFLVVAALVKTAAFPLHGWLTEVMEAPTPVSALLHAGIINAGGFLLLRMADLVQAVRVPWRCWSWRAGSRRSSGRRSC